MFKAYLAVLSFLLIGSSSAALADAKRDCEKLSGDAAIQACDQAIRQNPRDAEAYNNRGFKHYDKGDLDRALADFDKAIEIDPKASVAYDNRGVVFRAKGDLDRSIADYNEAIRLNPNDALAYNNRGIAYRAKGELDRAIAEAERDRGVVRAPWSGVVQDVAVEVGQAAFSFAGRELMNVVALDPMLAVAEVAERKLAGIRVGERADVRLVTGERASGQIRFVAKSASQATRTYRVEIELPNADGAIPDGITAEVIVPQSSVPATRLPRSALTFSSSGELGVRVVDTDDTVGFAPIAVVEDEQSAMWVTGVSDGSRVIVQGQDFVSEGQKVEAVGAHELTAVAQ